MTTDTIEGSTLLLPTRGYSTLQATSTACLWWYSPGLWYLTRCIPGWQHLISWHLALSPLAESDPLMISALNLL